MVVVPIEQEDPDEPVDVDVTVVRRVPIDDGR